MKILLPYFVISGTGSYPDSPNVLQIMNTVDFQGDIYYLCDYTGNKDLQTGATYAQYWKWLSRGHNKIIITSHNKRAIVMKGGELTVDIEIHDSDGNLLDITDSFAMPVGKVGGGNYTTLLLSFINGKATRSYTWPDAGEYEITKEMINMHLDESEKLDFDGFNITVAG